MGPIDNVERGRRRHKKLKAKFDQLLRIQFVVIFDVDVELDEDSVEVTLVDNA
ncbi:MAG: hypothetical protein WBI32_06055 [Halanaerobiales bacterium]